MNERLIERMTHGKELQEVLDNIGTADYQIPDDFLINHIAPYHQQLMGIIISIDAFIAAFPEIKHKKQFNEIYAEFTECLDLYKAVDKAIEKQAREDKL